MRRVLLFFIFFLVTASATRAAEYRFAIPRAEVTVHIQKDGSARIHYKLTFACAKGAHPIDIVDIGMPNLDHHEAVSAALDGWQLNRGAIQTSTYLKPPGCGYEVHLDRAAIQPGESGVFEFVGREENLVWQDTTDPTQASFRFSPTWFGSQYVKGQTQLTLRFVLPIDAESYPAVKDKILWQTKGQDFSVKGVMAGETHCSVAWVRTISLTRAHIFGISFPKRFVEHVRQDSLWDIFYRWFSTNPDVLMGSALLLLVLFTLFYLSATNATGCVIYLMFLGLALYGAYGSPKVHLFYYPLLVGLWGLLWYWRYSRKKHYFPAEVCIENGKIKRGLTAVEAAVLLEMPFNKVLTMIIFGMARKGVLEIRQKDPLKVKIVGREHKRGVWLRPDKEKVRLREYEPLFIHLFKGQYQKPVDDMRLDKAFDVLVEMVIRKVKGFDLEGTRKYYRYVVTRAWRQLKKEADYESRFKKADRNLPWLMMDDNWCTDLHGLGGEGYYYRPWWYYGHNQSSHYTTVPNTADVAGLSSPGTTFGDVANSLVGRMENFSTNFASRLDALESNTTANIDLSGIDAFTQEMLDNMSQGGGGGCAGGGCACAGCACACACAGGGR